MYIDAVVVKGIGKILNCTIETRNETDTDFVPLDLSPYAIRFRVLGTTVGNAKVLLEKIIDSFTDLETIGQILDANSGNFAFTITANDTEQLSLGEHPIRIDLLDFNTRNYIDTITEGGNFGEFSKIHIIQV